MIDKKLLKYYFVKKITRRISMTELTPIQKAIEIAGSQEKLAKMSGLVQGTISKYVRGHTITAEGALKIENATEKKVMRHELCPDVFIGYVPIEASEFIAQVFE